MGYLLVTAVLVVTLGRLGDMYGRVQHLQPRLRRLHASPRSRSRSTRSTARPGAHVADRLAGRAGRRRRDAAWPTRPRSSPTRSRPASAAWRWASTRSPRSPARSSGWSLGGLLAEWNWRAVFWVSVPIGVVGTVWALPVAARDRRAAPGPASTGRATSPSRSGLTALLAAHHLRHPALRRAQPTGWTNPWVLGRPASAAWRCWSLFVRRSRRGSPTRCSSSALFRIRAFAPGNLAGPARARSRRGGLQFMLIIWLQGIWLPLHGYDYE